MTDLSVLDLVPIVEGGTVGQAFANAADLAAHVEREGYKRYWIAEHHAMPAVGGAATAVAIGHAAAATRGTIRVGAGGIMLPNHAPLAIAEQFGTLAALYPGRVDLGLGRAPGSDQRTAQALRRTLAGGADQFPRDVMELQAYFAGDADAGLTGGVVATPGAGAEIEMWILGSSLYGAELAAILGLPFAFASHFAPDALDQALHLYRTRFRPSARLDKPHVMLGFNVFAADSDEEARLLASSHQQAFVALRTGVPRRLPPPVPGYLDTLPPQMRMMLEHMRSMSAIGTVDTVAERLAAFIRRTEADEIIVACQMFDHEKRKRSFTLAMEAMRRLAPMTA